MASRNITAAPATPKPIAIANVHNNIWRVETNRRKFGLIQDTTRANNRLTSLIMMVPNRNIQAWEAPAFVWGL